MAFVLDAALKSDQEPVTGETAPAVQPCIPGACRPEAGLPYRKCLQAGAAAPVLADCCSAFPAGYTDITPAAGPDGPNYLKVSITLACGGWVYVVVITLAMHLCGGNHIAMHMYVVDN